MSVASSTAMRAAGGGVSTAASRSAHLPGGDDSRTCQKSEKESEKTSNELHGLPNTKSRTPSRQRRINSRLVMQAEGCHALFHAFSKLP